MRNASAPRGFASTGPSSRCASSATDRLSTIQLAQGEPPVCGEAVEVVGFPQSDFFTLNLARAFWRKADEPRDDAASSAPLGCDIRDLVPEPGSRLHGRLVRIAGTIRRIPLPDEPNGCALIEDNGRILDVNPGMVTNAFDQVELGSRISVTGVAVIEKEYWRANLSLPQVKKAMLVLRGADDIRVFAGPPFWTPAKFLSVIVILSLLILAILLRNRTNQKLAEERINERTRLAAELHDTIAQNLAGAAIQLETAEAMSANGPEKLRRILALAVKIMHVSREELRDCIWDLRNRTLDEKHLADAFRRTLAPYLCETALRIRFPVNRDDVSDRSVHAALSITRELVASLQKVLDGEEVLSDDVRAVLKNDPPVAALSSRQREILDMLVRGLSNRDMADLLGISVTVVKEHITSLYAKLGAANRTEAVAIALRKHLLRI